MRFQGQVRFQRRRALVWSFLGPLGCLLTVGFVLAAAGLVGSWVSLRLERAPTLSSVLGLVVLAAAAVWLGWQRVESVRDLASARPRLVLYFGRRLDLRGASREEAWRAWNRGFAVARHLELLDRVAVAAGTEPLSAFGFNEDLWGQEVTWRPVGDLLRSLDAVASVAAVDPELAEDLAAWRLVLQEPAVVPAGVALLVRLGGDEWISPVEFDRRAGAFW